MPPVLFVLLSAVTRMSRLLQQGTLPLCVGLSAHHGTGAVALGECLVQLTSPAGQLTSPTWLLLGQSCLLKVRESGLRVGYCDYSETILSAAHTFLMFY